MEDIKKGDLSYILQLTDSATKFRCAMKVDPKTFNSYDELFEKYVKTINNEGVTSDSAKYLSVIQDCIYDMDDEGELLDLYEGLILKQDDDIVYLEEKPQFQFVQSTDSPDFMLLNINLDRSQITLFFCDSALCGSARCRSGSTARGPRSGSARWQIPVRKSRPRPWDPTTGRTRRRYPAPFCENQS